MKLAKSTKVIGCMFVAVAIYSAINNVVSQNYGSQLEARRACYQWVELDKWGRGEDSRGKPTRRLIRDCRQDKDTSQWLGLKIPSYEVIERFYY